MTESRWRKLFQPPTATPRDDIDDELRFHIETLARDLIAHGMPSTAAHDEAARRFGAVDPVRAACLTIDQRRQRRAARSDIVRSMLFDLKYAMRTFRAAPGFAVTVTLTLGLGVGATCVMAGIVDGALLHPLPYAGADRLVALSDVQRQVNVVPNSYPEYLDWKARLQIPFASVGAWFQSNTTLMGAGDPLPLRVIRMSASVPAILSVTPVAGVSIRESDDPSSAPRVVMVSERLWHNRFNSSPTLIGSTITLNDVPWTVIGIFPSTTASLMPGELSSAERADLWMPLRGDPEHLPRGLHFISTIARLRPGVTIEQARRAVLTTAQDLRRSGVTSHDIRMTPLGESVAGSARMPVLLLFGAVGILLLIACVNVAVLLLARAGSKRREVAVRVAIGAGRSRIMLQLLVESVVRGVAGGVVGAGLAYCGMWAVHRWLGPVVPRFARVGIDGRVFAATLALAAVTGLAFGMVPAIRAAREDVIGTLRDGGKGTSGGGRRDRLRRGLIVGEIALSFMLLVGAGLAIRTVRALLATPMGINSQNVVSMYVTLPAKRYPDSTADRAFMARLLSELSTLPGMKGVALSNALPGEWGPSGNVEVEGQNYPPNVGPQAEKRVVSSNYFDVMGAHVVSGRAFAPTDIAGALPVVMLSQAFVKKWIDSKKAVGARVDFAWDTKGMQTVAGVVADIKEEQLGQESLPAIYIPIEQHPQDGAYILARTTLDPAAAVASIRARLKTIDPLMPLTQVRTLDDVIEAGVAGQRVSSSILVALAAMALLLAAVGLFGVVSYTVTERTGELGIRSALGARHGQLLGLVMRDVAGFVIAGLVVGGGVSLLLGRFVSGQLYGVTATDPLTYVIVAVVLSIVALAAAVLPARRTLRIDPVAALRRG